MDGGGALLGYFFLLDHAPTAVQLAAISPREARQVMMLGDLGLIEGSWPVLSGPLPGWDRERWPLPEFKLYDELRKRWEIRTYDEKLRLPVAIRVASEAEVKDLPKDGLAGAGAVEAVLQQLAGTTRPVKAQRSAA